MERKDITGGSCILTAREAAREESSSRTLESLGATAIANALGEDNANNECEDMRGDPRDVYFGVQQRETMGEKGGDS